MKLKEMFALAFGSVDEKARLAYVRAERLGKRHGFHVHTRHMVWKDQHFFRKAREQAEGITGIPDPRSFVLQSCLRALANVEGDVAECGVRNGRSTLFMLTADLRERQYHLFDSFEGLSDPSSEDRMKGGAHRWKKGDLSASEARVRETLSGFSNLHFHVGWIPQTLGAVSDKAFAFVHIDVDLYEPTRDSLAFFFDRVVPGGLIVCDDYGSAYCPGARKAFDEFFANRAEKIIELPTGQALVWKNA